MAAQTALCRPSTLARPVVILLSSPWATLPRAAHLATTHTRRLDSILLASMEHPQVEVLWDHPRSSTDRRAWQR
jgi:hypothetical protein